MVYFAKQSHQDGDAPAVTPPAQPREPGIPVPPPATQTPHPSPSCAPQGRVPTTDGTPAPCRQKNAAGFLAGDTPGVMATYGSGGREPDSPIPTLENEDTVRDLVHWRQEAPYG